MKIILVLLIAAAAAFSFNFMGFADFVRQKKINYGFERNDARLLEKLNLKKPRNWQEESAVIAEIAAHPEQLENNAVLFVGGFADAVNAYLYRVVPEFKNRLTEQGISFDVYYRHHDELHGIKELFTLYRKQGKKIIIVGHSWGACSLFKEFWQDTLIQLDLVVSLDPVGLVRPDGKAGHIKKWLNVYLDYTTAPITISNTIARIGQPFGKRDNADVNICTQFNHQQASKMFFAYAWQEILTVK